MRWLFRKILLKLYKRQKVKISRKEGSALYKVMFKLMLNDPGGQKMLGYFEIEVPDRSLYDVKKRIREFINEKMDIEVIDFEQKNEDTE